MRKISLTIAAVALAAALNGTAIAAVNLDSVTPGTNPYSGPAPTYDFDTPGTTPGFTNGAVITTGTSPGLYAQPFGSVGNYFSVGPSTSSPAWIDLTGFGDINTLSLLWGSVDDYNTLYFLDSSFNILASFGGTAIFNPANGNQTDPNTNPVVSFSLNGGDQSAFSYLGFTSSQNAFEVDDIAVNGAVPEPATWLMMILGFGAVGFSIRRRNVLPKLAQLA